MMDLEIGGKYRIRLKSTKSHHGPVPGSASKKQLTVSLEQIVPGFRMRHFLFRSGEGWLISLSEWEIEQEYEINPC